MARIRDYKAEYQRRIKRGRARGLSRAQSRGHPRAGEKFVSPRLDPKASTPAVEAGLKALHRGGTLKSAAKTAGVSQERLRRFIRANGYAKRKGRSWITTDPRPRRVVTYSAGDQLTLVVDGYEEAALAGAYWDAAGRFVATNDIELLEKFKGRRLRDRKGRFHTFETDPNAVHELVMRDEPAFHEIYAIVSN